jgi:predicted N-acetyltransferase YhbS
MEYREYRPGDEQQLNDLYNEVFSRRRTIEQWKWQYRDAPAGPSKIVVIDDDGEIVGHEAMIPIHFHAFGGAVIGGKFEDNYLSERHRGKGLFGPLVDYCAEVSARAGYSFSFGMAARKVPYRIHIHRGYRHLGSLNAYFAPLHPAEAASEIARALGFSSPKRLVMRAGMRILANRFEGKTAERANGAAGEYAIEAIDRFDQRFDEMWREFTRRSRVFSIARSSAFLNWRYIDNPYRKYAVFAARRENRVAAYLCAAVVVRDDMDLRLKVGVIPDFLALPGHEAAYAPLVRRALDVWRSAGADVAIVWTHGEGEHIGPLVSEIKRRGLLSTFGRYDIPVLVKTFDPAVDTESFYDIRLWHLTQAFSAAWV